MRPPAADRWRAVKNAPPRHQLKIQARVPTARDATGFFRSVTA